MTATLPGQRKAAAGAGRPLASVSIGRFAVGGNGVLPSPREHEGPSRGGRSRPARMIVASRARGAFALRRAGRRPENLPRPETAGGTRYRAVHVDAKGAPAAGSASGSAGSCFGRSAAGRWGPAGNSPRLQALDRRVGCLPRAGVWDAQCASVGRTG